jgi:H+/Cl- antiporter ClcA
MPPARRRPGLTRVHNSSFFLGAGGLRFNLIDHYHRRHDVAGIALRLWAACVIIGVSASIIGVLVDLMASGLYEVRVGLCEAVDDPLQRYAVWLGTAAVTALGAAALLKVVPAAAGSGLPEVKEALSGIVLFDAFSTRVLMIKPLSLALAIASSLSIGKEGPFIHCACCVAYLVVSRGVINFSHHVREQRELEGLIAACAAGVVCTFGAPVGGVLFSAEITSTGTYNVEHVSASPTAPARRSGPDAAVPRNLALWVAYG